MAAGLSTKFNTLFIKHILPFIQTPRQAIRYANSISFYYPLVKGEVNFVDFLLLESIKLLFPKHYSLLKANKNQLIRINWRDDSPLLKELNSLNKNLNSKEQKAVTNLIQELFPSNPYTQYTDLTTSYRERQKIKGKHICSDDYIDRYFAYTVVKGELSDIKFEDFVDNLENYGDSTGSRIKDLLSKEIKYAVFLDHLTRIEGELSWVASKNIILGILECTDLMSLKGRFFSIGFDNDFKRSCAFIFRFLSVYKEEKEFSKFAQYIFNSVEQNHFLLELERRLCYPEESEKSLFKKSDLKKIWRIIIEKCKNEALEKNFFEYHSFKGLQIIRIWSDLDRTELDKYVAEYLALDENNVINLLVTFSESLQTNKIPTGFKSDLSRTCFEKILKYADVELINKYVEQIRPNLDLIDVEWLDGELRENNAENTIKQFKYWYNEPIASSGQTHLNFTSNWLKLFCFTSNSSKIIQILLPKIRYGTTGLFFNSY